MDSEYISNGKLVNSYFEAGKYKSGVKTRPNTQTNIGKL